MFGVTVPAAKYQSLPNLEAYVFYGFIRGGLHVPARLSPEVIEIE
jgi:hypothetical protein